MWYYLVFINTKKAFRANTWAEIKVELLARDATRAYVQSCDASYNVVIRNNRMTKSEVVCPA